MTQADWSRFMLRLPPDLKRWVDSEAERNGASINSEIIRSVRERMDRVESSVKSIDISGENPASVGEIPAKRGRSATTVALNEKSDDGQSLAAPVVAPGDHDQPVRTEDERSC